MTIDFKLANKFMIEKFERELTNEILKHCDVYYDDESGEELMDNQFIYMWQVSNVFEKYGIELPEHTKRDCGWLMPAGIFLSTKNQIVYE